jgi:hypothetical protein
MRIEKLRIEFCCEEMKWSVLKHDEIRLFPIQGSKTRFKGVKIEHCPYCGAEITYKD